MQPDGARDYIVNDRMIGGFALIATPADYGNSGVMTFVINQDGVVYEKDLGPESAADAAKIRIVRSRQQLAEGTDRIARRCYKMTCR